MTIAMRQIPNALTFLRLVLIIPFAVSLYTEAYRQAVVIFFIAGFSDGLDGYLARRFNWKSRFGAIADPLADKCLLVSAYLMLTITGVLPWWLFVVVMLRDIWIVAGALFYHYRVSAYEMSPSRLGKANTFLQILFILVVMLDLAGIAMPEMAVEYGMWLIVVMAVLSAGQYTVVWSRRALALWSKGKH